MTVKGNAVNRYLKLISDSSYRFRVLSKYGFFKRLSDEKYIRKKWKALIGGTLNLEHPSTYTEKLQGLKLHDRRPVYATMVDKYAARQFVSERIGEEYLLPCLGVWDSVDDIPFDTLPDKFVLKCTHDSGSIVVCQDKATFDKKAAKMKLTKALKCNYFHLSREWPYKNATPRIIAEPFLVDSETGELRDYKFFTFGGVPKFMYITKGRRDTGIVTADFFDMDFQHLDMKIDHETADVVPACPKNFELMQKFAAKLSEGTPQLRVDFYEIDGKLYFGEMTFFHCGGFCEFTPNTWNQTLGDWIDLP